MVGWRQRPEVAGIAFLDFLSIFFQMVGPRVWGETDEGVCDRTRHIGSG